jgi:hypothetical protein
MKKGIKNAKLNGSEAVPRRITSPISPPKTPTRVIPVSQRMFNAANAFPNPDSTRSMNQETSQENENIPNEYSDKPMMRGDVFEDDEEQEEESYPKLNNTTILDDLGDFPEFSSLITHTYWGPMTQNSTTLDIIAVYLRGQKTLYIDSKNHCEQKLNYLMMPTIFITAVCSIISMVLKDYDFGAILVSSLSGVSSFILAIINYLGLDAKAQAHKTTAYQFDKLQTMCEFFSGKVLLIKDKDVNKKVQDFVEHIEKKVEEIKDVNQYIIPEIIRHRYPKIYSINVFSEIKRYKNREKILRSELHNLCKKIDDMKSAGRDIPEELVYTKEMKLKQVLEHQNEYFKVDDQFEEEVTAYVEKTKNKAGCCGKRKRITSSRSEAHSETPKSISSGIEIRIPETPFKSTAPSKIIPTVSTTETMKSIPASAKLAEISSASRVPK